MIERDRLVLIGHPVSHSLSPMMHDAALEALGSSLRYETLDVPPDRLAEILTSLKKENVAGNITIPHKRSAIESMGKLTATARRVGAVNVFWRDDDGDLAADNTDVFGFQQMATGILGELPQGARVAVLGAGGAAAAVVTALESWPGAIATVHARDLSRAVAMRMRHSVVVRACSMRDPCIADADIVVNATPLGLSESDPHPVELERVSRNALLLDLAYGTRETPWVRAAQQAGMRAFSGLPMLLHQGIAAFERWFGVEPDKDVMWSALQQAIESR
jgi:shikimate dehydrogenase